MRTPLLLLGVIVLVQAKTYKGTQSLKVGKKTYKCAFNIVYTTTACKKKTVKCKPNPKKLTLEFPEIEADDAILDVTVVKNKITTCKVAEQNPVIATIPPPTPGGGGGEGPSEQMNCNCRMPLVDQPPIVRSLGASVTKMLITTNPTTGLAKGRMAMNRGGGHGHGHYHPNPPQNYNPTPSFTDLIPLIVIAIIAGLVGALKGELISNLLGLRSLEHVDDVAERDRQQARILSKLEERQDLGGLLGNLGGGDNGLGGILGGLLGGAGGNNGGGNGGGGDNGLGGLLGGILGVAGGNNGGGNGGGGDNGVGGILGGLLGGGNNEGGSTAGAGNALTEAILQNMINQIISNPDSLQELINIAVQSGLAEQFITNLIESGDIAALVQSLVDSGAGPDIIANLGNGLLQELLGNNDNLGNLGQNLTQILEGALNGMEPGSLESVLAGVDVQNMELNMKCSCTKEEPLIFPIPGK